MSKMTPNDDFGQIHYMVGKWCLKVLDKELADISPQEIDKILKFLKDNAITGTREGVVGEVESALANKFRAPHLPDLDEALEDVG